MDGVSLIYSQGKLLKGAWLERQQVFEELACVPCVKDALQALFEA